MKLLKSLLPILFLFCTASTLFGQDITGEWNGALNVQGAQLRLVFHIEQTENGFTSTMDSPDQGAIGIPTTETSFEHPNLEIKIANLNISYQGKFNEDNTIEGTFIQNAHRFPLNLSREKIEAKKVERPQEPKAPFPYTTEEVKFNNDSANITLAGTLTLPKQKGKFPAVILISGSGPQNRDEEVFGHKPFLVLADKLTRNGIAVLRYDDRGTAESTGDFTSATSADFATDVESALKYLKSRKEIHKKKIGLLGHSEGGLIAPLVANRNKDVDFIVLLAGPGVTGERILLAQQELIGKASGFSDEKLTSNAKINQGAFNMIKNAESQEQLVADLTNYFKENGIPEGEIPTIVSQSTSPWMKHFLTYDPSVVLQQVNCPVLALNGANDLQVPAKENLEAIEQALKTGGNKCVTIQELPGLNHFFQESKTGLPSEYANIEQTISPKVLDKITKWIQLQTK